MYTSGDVMDMAAAALNDNGKKLYNYSVQLPYLRMATRDLDQELTANEIPVSLVTEAIIPVLAGAMEIDLPPGFFLPISIYERENTTRGFYPMMEKAIASDYASRTPTSDLLYWDYRHNCININPPTRNLEVRLNYWRTLPPIINQNQTELIIGGINTLGFRTAELCARYIGGNRERADSLAVDYQMARDTLITIYTKNNQGKRVRRKPFRVGV